MDFAKLEWLFPLATTLHNAEEAIWMPSWDATELPCICGWVPLALGGGIAIWLAG